MSKPSLNGLVRSIAVLASGTAAAQVILLVTSPLLTRLYSPDQFGLLAAYMATVTILGALATLRYELVIALPRRDDIAINALALTMLCVVFTAIACAVVFVLFVDQIAATFHMPALPKISWLVPVGVLSIGTYTAFNNWAVRQRTFGTIARTKLTQSVMQTGIQVGAAFTPFATLGLLLGNLIGQSAGISSFVRDFNSRDRHTLASLKWRRVWFLARHYRDFPIFSLPASVAFSASQQAPALVMYSLFGPATAGFYLLAQRVGMMPATLLGTAMSQSLTKNLADNKKDPRAIGVAVLKPVNVMSNMIIAPAALMAIIAPLLTSVFFGSDWTEAGHYLRWMAPLVASTIIFGAMTPVVSILKLQKMGLVFQVGSLLLSLASMVPAGKLWGPVAAIAAFSIVKSACIVVYRLHMFHLLHIAAWPVARRLLLQTLLFPAGFWLAESVLQQPELANGLRISLSVLIILFLGGVYIWLNRSTLTPTKDHNAKISSDISASTRSLRSP